MLKNDRYKELSFIIINDKSEILKYLPLGTKIPVWIEFHDYILHDLKFFKTKSIIMSENGNPIGHILIFNVNAKILYFGYFQVLNHNGKKIEYLLDYLLDYAKNNGFETVRGPINIPVIIFGWGFMKKGSLENLFIGKPVNPPIYQDIFLKKGFYVKSETNTWEGSFPKLNPWKMRGYNFSDYEYFNPNDIIDYHKYKEKFLAIHEKNLPESARVTPTSSEVVDSYANFIFEFGYNSMIFFIRYKITNEIVACGACLPNPFRKDKRGNYDSVVVYTWAVEPEHRRKGLTLLMFGATSLLLWDKKVRYGSGPVSSDNLANTEVAKKLGAYRGRTHLILEYQIQVF